jgi:hypothetical protein
VASLAPRYRSGRGAVVSKSARQTSALRGESRRVERNRMRVPLLSSTGPSDRQVGEPYERQEAATSGGE